MERRKALVASTAVAASLVIGSFAYAATNLITPTPGDHVGQLSVTAARPVERPVQYVYDEVPGSPPPGWSPEAVSESGAGPVSSAEVLDDDSTAADPERSDDAATTTTTAGATTPSTTARVEHEDDRDDHDEEHDEDHETETHEEDDD